MNSTVQFRLYIVGATDSPEYLDRWIRKLVKEAQLSRGHLDIDQDDVEVHYPLDHLDKLTAILVARQTQPA